MSILDKALEIFFSDPHEREKSLALLTREKVGWATLPQDCLLQQTYSPPPILFFRGDFNLLKKRNFAIVGSRYPSRKSVDAAVKFSSELGSHGFTIISGLARGVDAFAHEGALRTVGKTIAVMGCGLDRIYPPENLRLAHQILDAGGLLLSEYPPGIPPLKHNFPRRNRVIAGNAVGVLVVEAREKSGSLITAQFAIDEGREVFVLPGDWEDPKFLGGNRLLKDGATLVSTPSDLLNCYGIEQEKKHSLWHPTFFQPGINDLADLWSRSGLSLSELSEILERAIRQKIVKEISPQKFILTECGDESACQIN